jgi:hypothetical protein
VSLLLDDDDDYGDASGMIGLALVVVIFALPFLYLWRRRWAIGIAVCDALLWVLEPLERRLGGSVPQGE